MEGVLMTLQECFEQVPDPRRAEGRRYELTPLLIGTILAIACGATSYRKVHRFLAAHWRRVIAVFGGTWKRAPAYTTVRNVLHELDPAALEAAFRAHSQGLLVRTRRQTGVSPSTARCCVVASITLPTSARLSCWERSHTPSRSSWPTSR